MIVRKDGQGIRFELCERKQGVRVLGPDRPEQSAVATPHRQAAPVFGRDPSDTLLAQGKYAQLPLEVIVPDRLDGFLLYEQYGGIGRGKSIVWIDGKGKPALALALGDLFAELPRGTTQSVSSTRWGRGCFVDERAASIVAVAVDDSFREIAIADGSVTTPSPEQVAAWCGHGAEDARALVLDVVARGDAQLLRTVSAVAMEIFHSEAQPMALRLRAAIVLKAVGTPVACEPLFVKSRTRGPWRVRCYAVRHLVDALGPKAVPDLIEMMCSEKTSLWGEAWQALVSAGPVAAPALMALFADRGRSTMGRSGAASALARIGTRAAVPSLLDGVVDPDESLANAACNAAIAIAGVDCRDRLISHLLAGTSQDGRIALFLQRHPTRAALPAIEAACAREQDATEKQWLALARIACSRGTK